MSYAGDVLAEEGAVLLEKMTGKRAEVMPDPVCLLTRNEWETVMTAASAVTSVLKPVNSGIGRTGVWGPLHVAKRSRAPIQVWKCFIVFPGK